MIYRIIAVYVAAPCSGSSLEMCAPGNDARLESYTFLQPSIKKRVRFAQDGGPITELLSGGKRYRHCNSICTALRFPLQQTGLWFIVRKHSALHKLQTSQFRETQANNKFWRRSWWSLRMFQLKAASRWGHDSSYLKISRNWETNVHSF